jgi:hypothetical protein
MPEVGRGCRLFSTFGLAPPGLIEISLYPMNLVLSLKKVIGVTQISSLHTLVPVIEIRIVDEVLDLSEILIVILIQLV